MHISVVKEDVHSELLQHSLQREPSIVTYVNTNMSADNTSPYLGTIVIVCIEVFQKDSGFVDFQPSQSKFTLKCKLHLQKLGALSVGKGRKN